LEEDVAVGLEKVILKPMFLSETHLRPVREKPVGQLKQKVGPLLQVAQLLLQATHIPVGKLFRFCIK
jgi:hypothetical protein